MTDDFLHVDSKVILDPLNNEFVKYLTTWKQTMQSSYGPNGKPKLIQNTIGGHTTITTQFGRLLRTTQSSHPLMKILLSSASNHEKKFSDFGGFSLLLAIRLVDSALKLQLNNSFVADLYNKFGNIIINHLEGSCCTCAIPVKLTCIKTLKSIITPILDSKPVCMLSRVETNYLTALLLNAFFLIIPDTNSRETGLGCVSIKTQEGLSPLNSRVYKGLLLPAPDDHLKSLRINIASRSERMAIALFNISLAGNSESLDILYEIQDEAVDLNEVIQQKINNLSKTLESSKVNIVACQKVIHPSLIKILEERGIIVISRLGENNFHYLKYLSGGKPITSELQPINADDLGFIQKLELIKLQNQYYLHIQNETQNICSLILCNSNEESLEELKVTVNQALDSLKLLLLHPKVVVGGGCLETHLAGILKKQVCLQLKDLESSGYGKGQIDIILTNFISSLISMSQTLYQDNLSLSVDRPNYHLWLENGISETQTCACGLVDRTDTSHFIPIVETSSCPYICKTHEEKCAEIELQNKILDNAVAKTNAFKVAFETSTLLLKLGLVIKESS